MLLGSARIPNTGPDPDPQHWLLCKIFYCCRLEIYCTYLLLFPLSDVHKNVISELLLMHPDIDATLVNNQGDTAMEVAARSVLPTTTMGTIHYNRWIKVMPLTSFSVLRTVPWVWIRIVKKIL
jgi:hypothetical protein